MVKLYDGGVYLVNGREIVTDPAALPGKCGRNVTKEEAEQGTIAYGILKAHNKSGDMQNLRMRFDSLTSHDITYVGIIQTARASATPVTARWAHWRSARAAASWPSSLSVAPTTWRARAWSPST